jgi:hypothetical protein
VKCGHCLSGLLPPLTLGVSLDPLPVPRDLVQRANMHLSLLTIFGPPKIFPQIAYPLEQHYQRNQSLRSVDLAGTLRASR